MVLGVVSVSGGIFANLLPAVREYSNELSNNNPKLYQSDLNSVSITIIELLSDYPILNFIYVAMRYVLLKLLWIECD